MILLEKSFTACEKMNLEKQEQKQNSDSRTLQQQREKNNRPVEIGGPKGLEPTRYGDWERRGRCIDF